MIPAITAVKLATAHRLRTAGIIRTTSIKLLLVFSGFPLSLRMQRPWVSLRLRSFIPLGFTECTEQNDIGRNNFHLPAYASHLPYLFNFLPYISIQKPIKNENQINLINHHFRISKRALNFDKVTQPLLFETPTRLHEDVDILHSEPEMVF
ncbi:hypothetical protein CROQUDRAFT_88707 [Cronartium quercuum f. sp. fusiforme G11]|uniref:Uncharacterized protein n=1 Tax=Cronartium quercuum f. sp. fusiforme G11 TaxID=708437 RepID=A0A9P6TFF4_9BASI|nr:hypothetical protein CROQUDRAFT_88707 [Cronartium quercuum f. sp. fusiforme G11]